MPDFSADMVVVGYVTLNGNGPTAIDALTALENTNSSEAYTALGLMVNARSVLIGLSQAGLLAGSYLSGRLASALLRATLAAALVAITTCAWAQLLWTHGAAFLPTRQDWENFPYGSLIDLIDTLMEIPVYSAQPPDRASRFGGGARQAVHRRHLHRRRNLSIRSRLERS